MIGHWPVACTCVLSGNEILCAGAETLDGRGRIRFRRIDAHGQLGASCAQYLSSVQVPNDWQKIWCCHTWYDQQKYRRFKGYNHKVCFASSHPFSLFKGWFEQPSHYTSHVKHQFWWTFQPDCGQTIMVIKNETWAAINSCHRLCKNLKRHIETVEISISHRMPEDVQ